MARLSKNAIKQLDQVRMLLTSSMPFSDDTAARTLAAFHRAGNQSERKAADELRSEIHSLLERTLYVNDCMIHRDDYRPTR